MRPTWMVLGLCAALAGTCVADEKPGKALKQAVKTTLKAESYRVEFELEGGFAEGPEHELLERHVGTSVEARSFGRLTAIDAPFRGYRLEDGEVGAINSGGSWLMLTARPTERIAERLFLPLTQVLKEIAAMHRTAVWSEDGTQLQVTGTSKLAVALFNGYQSAGCFDDSPESGQQQGGQQGQQQSGGGC